MTTITIESNVAHIAADAIKTAAWEIARKAAAQQLFSESPVSAFFAQAVAAPDDLVAQINSLMTAAAELDGIAGRDTWAPSMIDECKAEIAAAKDAADSAAADLEAARGTDGYNDALAAWDKAQHRAHEISAI